MSEAVDKRRKVDNGISDVSKQNPVRKSKIFSPFRVLGNVTNETPFAVGSLGSTFFIVTSIGRVFQIYDVATLHLLFVSEGQTPLKITCLFAHYHYVYAAYANKIGIYKRGKLEHTLVCPTNNSVNNILVFGDFVVATTAEGEIFIFKKPKDSKVPIQFYSSLSVINAQLDGEVVAMIHPQTYLNKVVVATTNHLFIINVRTGKLVFKTAANAFNESISCIEAAPALDIIAVGTSSGGVYLYNLKKGRVLGSRIGVSASDESSKVVAVSFRTDGSLHLVAGLSSGDLFFYDLLKKSRIHILRNAHREEHGGIANVKFLNGQSILVSNGGDNHLKEFVFDPTLSASNSSIVSPPRHLRSRGGHSAPPVAIEFPDENKSHFILSASRDRSLWSFSLRKDAQAQELSQRYPKSKNGKRQPGQVSSFREKFPEVISLTTSQAREGEWENIISAHKDETFARTWDSRNKKVGRHTLATVDSGFVKAVCISHCGNFGIVGSSKGGIGVYNLQSGLIRKKYILHKNAVTGLSIDGMNRKMVSCGLDGIVGFYDFTQLKYLGKLRLDAPITSMIYHKSTDLVACSLDDLTIVVIDTSTQRVVRVFYGHTNRVTSMDFSPDGRWIVSVSLDGTLRTWDLPTGGCIDGIILPSVATNVRFSPIGDFLATTHVTGNGIFLWTNKSQFGLVSTRHIDVEEFATMLLPTPAGDSNASIIDGALENHNKEDVEFHASYTSVDQIDEKLVTLSVGPRSKYSTLIHLDAIKKRNKPIQPAKRPDQAPFFLSLSGNVVGDRASEAEGRTPHSRDLDILEDSSRLHKLKSDALHTFESRFTKLLRECSESDDYLDFLKYLVEESPSSVNLEIRSLNTFPPLSELTSFVSALNQGLRSNKNYDLYQSMFSIFAKIHGDVLYSNDDTDLKSSLEKWNELNEQRSVKMDDLVKYCSGVINFLTTV
ncbi:uncharacterized protein PRCAT00003880001 [Priceomyces carsonii]|uniref:uncharacterized protein n=1 Tax=Priceomyces carsonii TaxID=28549 RepID=UPI002ED9CDF6|nr:unnamed protein product [Priceomyces carsonii]